MEKRLFVGIELDPSVLVSIVQLVEKLRAKYYHPENRIAWVRPENLHLTLKFLGATPVHQIASMGELLKQAVDSIPGFELTMEGVDAFVSSSSRVRTPYPLWIGFSS